MGLRHRLTLLEQRLRSFGHRRRREAPTFVRRKPAFEMLEQRLLLSVDLVGIPTWVEQGPGPTTGGQVENLGATNPVSGAIEVVVPHPTDPNIAWVGAVNGGIWRTGNATAANPTWTPLTDMYPSLSVGDLALSPLDGTNNTLFAGAGRYSAGFRDGGPLTGLLLTTDGGNNWTKIGGATFDGINVRTVLPTSINLVTGQVVMVASDSGGGGIFRSVDGGNTFALVSGTSGTTDGIDNDADGATDEAGEVNLPTGPGMSLVADPGNAQRFYAAVQGDGVFRSDNGGANWQRVNTGLTLTGDGADNDGDGTVDEGDEDADGAGRIELSVHNSVGNNAVYAALIGSGSNDRLMGVFRSANQGGTWTVIGNAPAIHPGTQGNVHFAILADQTSPNQVYVGGDRQAGAPFVANIFVGDASTNTWTQIVRGGANNTAGHADSRDMAFDANGNILEGNDGGIVRLVNPTNAATRTWVSVNGNIRPTELYIVGYDSINNAIFGGTQDTGSTEQTAFNNTTWREVNQGDGGYAAAANFAATSTHYTMGNTYRTFMRRDFDNTYTLTDSDQVQLAAAATPAVAFSGLNAADQLIGGFTFTPFAINTVAPARMLLGNSGLYEDDQTGAAHETGDIIANVTPAGFGGVVSLAYGGRTGGADNPDVAYVGDGNNDIWLRTTAGGAFNLTNFDATAGTGTPLDIVLDPEDWNTAYVIDDNDVFVTRNAGNLWTNLTENLDDFMTDLRTVTLVTGTTDVLLVGGVTGVFRSEVGVGVTPRWSEYGTGLANALVSDLVYNAGDDVLVAATRGRGAWTIGSVTTSVFDDGLVRYTGDGNVDRVELVRRANNPLLLDVFVNFALAKTVEWAAVERIEVNTLGNDDLLIVNFANGDVVPVDGIDYDGGLDDDELDLRNGTFGTVTYTATSTIDGRVDLGPDDQIRYDFVQQVTDTTSATNRVFTAAGTGAQTIRLVDVGGPDGVSRIDSGGAIDFAVHDFATPGASLTINAGGGNDDVQLLDVDAGPFADVTINGDAGDDDIRVDLASDVAVVTVNGGTEFDTLAVNGTVLDDVLVLTPTVITRNGTQTVTYFSIEDLTLGAGDGEDDVTVNGTGPHTTVLGGGGDDDFTVNASGPNGLELDGQGDSDDYIVNFGSLASPVIVQDLGASGTDTLLVNGTSADDTIVVTGVDVTSGGETVAYSGIEELTVDAGDGNDLITIDGTGADSTEILGGDGDDDFVLNGSGPGSLRLDGQEGSDDYAINLGGTFTGPVEIDDTGTGPTDVDSLLINGTSGDDWIILEDDGFTVGGLPAIFTFHGIENLTVNAGAGDDIVDGSLLTMMVTIFGGTGDDTLIGGSNDDHLYGEEDDDDLIGNLGADYLDGGSGSDALIGDQCVQGDKGRLEHETVTGPARILSIPGGKLTAIVDVPGTNRRLITLLNEAQGDADTLVGGTGDDYAHGGAGNDAISGDDGADALFGNLGDDHIAGGTGDDHLYGGSGNDCLNGDAGADIAYGGDGDDRLVADRKEDRLIDWFGNFNDFVVPGPGYGAPTIVRSPSPWVQAFLLNLARADGAANPNSEIVVVVPGSGQQQSNSGKGGRGG